MSPFLCGTPPPLVGTTPGTSLFKSFISRKAWGKVGTPVWIFRRCCGQISRQWVTFVVHKVACGHRRFSHGRVYEKQANVALSGSTKRKMSTASVSEDIGLKFPLHSAVWENDYRKLEEQITSPQVGKCRKPSHSRLVAGWSHGGEMLNVRGFPVKVGQSCWQMRRGAAHTDNVWENVSEGNCSYSPINRFGRLL